MKDRPGTLVYYRGGQRHTVERHDHMYSTALMVATHYIDAEGNEVPVNPDGEGSHEAHNRSDLL